MVKISFSGIPGSGKTSVVTEVKKILSLKYKVESTEEISLKNPFDEDQKSCFVSQFFYITTQINEENIKSSKSLDYLLCDRSVLDQWIYWKNYFCVREANNNLEEKNELLVNLYKFWMKTYDLIFLIKVDFKELEKRDSDNELRTTDPEYNKRIDELFTQTIKDDNIKVIEIWNNNTIDECAHKIIEHISEYKQVPEA